jgi:hypothetical protein
MRFLKKLLLWGILGGILYGLLSYHFILVRGKKLRILKKSELTLEHTIFSTHGKKMEKILEIDALREDGIADILEEEGLITEKEKRKLLRRYDE